MGVWGGVFRGGRVGSLGGLVDFFNLCVVLVFVFRFLFTLRVRFIGFVVGDMVEFFCEVRRGFVSILYSFYFNGEILGNCLVFYGGVVFFFFSLMLK